MKELVDVHFPMAEIEPSVLANQCLDRRLPGTATVRCEVSVWQARRNAEQAKIHWHFTAEVARAKLKHLYPS